MTDTVALQATPAGSVVEALLSGVVSVVGCVQSRTAVAALEGSTVAFVGSGVPGALSHTSPIPSPSVSTWSGL